MNDPIFEDYPEDYYNPVLGYMNTLFPTRDLIRLIEPKIKQWTLDSRIFTDRKEACLIAWRMFIFFKGVKVVKQLDKYFILYWSDKE